QAEALIAAGEDKLLMVHAPHWHQGVIGIIAGRLKERYHLPAAVISFDKDGMGKASARSIHGFDFGAAVLAARELGILAGGGGHAMAAGFSVARNKLSELQAFLSDRIAAVS